MKKFLIALLLIFIAAPAYARLVVADNLSADMAATVEIQDEPESYGPPYEPPAEVKEEVYRVETNPCDSKDVKEFLVGNYIIVGQKKSSGGVPAKTDLYTAAAHVKLESCDLNITLCTAEGSETGQMKGILALADKIPMWKIEAITKTGELKEYFLQMTSDLDNYPVLYGWGHQGYEFWRPAHDENIACP